jgi:hypothetical protein
VQNKGSAVLLQAFVETLMPRTQTSSCLDICGADITDQVINLFYDKLGPIICYFIGDTFHAPMYYS